MHSKTIDADYYIKRIEYSDAMPLTECLDFRPSWQNSFDAIARNPQKFKAFGAFLNKNLVGYIIFEKNSGDITQIAVNKSHRRRGIATALLEMGLMNNKHHSVKVINTELQCTSISNFLISKGIELKGKQYEMIKQL